MKSLWDRVCTLPITHKLNFGQICVHETLMGPCVYFLWDPSFLINRTLVKYEFINSLWNREGISYGTLPITHKLIFGKHLCAWNPYGTVSINSLWTLCVCSLNLMEPLVNSNITYKLIFGKMCVHEILMGPCVSFLMGPFILLIYWTLVKSVFMKSLWDRVCISYGTLPITHKLNFCQICVHKILMGQCVHFLWDPSYYS